MTTNQTIDGVPRAALAVMLSEPRHRAPYQVVEARAALRALLDAPVCGLCGKPTVCGKATCEDCAYEMPAAQPQGEPVAWRFRVSDSGDWFATTKASVAEMFHNSSDGGQAQPLYAEQPAPRELASVVARRDDQLFNSSLLLKRAAKLLAGVDPDDTSWFEVVGELEKLYEQVSCKPCQYNSDKPRVDCTVCNGTGLVVQRKKDAP